ncbi:hypothetical protein EDC96DRAFT_495455 [Choanephora cucurbitarum]|nr:hypothetical protein EDC96DRAFT_495455 [Choanephora cucurbitarum]
MTFNVFLLELKLSIVKVESIAKLMHLNKDALCLVRSHYDADYIATELKSPSRIIRNTLKATCPVVHIDWLVDSLALNKILLDPTPYIIDVSTERRKVTSSVILPLPNQVTWKQLAEAYQLKYDKDFDKKVDYKMICKERQSYFCHKGRKSAYKSSKRKKRYNQK